ncbi:MAG TPA: AI-2E family transporter [Acidimicrobiia bacterium]|nr:AI-2E family transporter [Acidimicrobiia bacterium]
MTERRPTEHLRRSALIVWTVIGSLVLFGLVAWMANQVRIIWLPLVFAVGLVIILDPIASSLQRAGIPRLVGTVFAFVVFTGFLVAIGFLAVPTVQEQAADFGKRLPVLYDETIEFLQDAGDDLGVDLGPVWTSETISSWIADPSNQETLQNLVGGFGSGAGRLIRGVAETVAVVALAPVLAFYILLDLPRTKRLAVELVPASVRNEFQHVSTRVATAVAAFVRGQLLVALFVGVLSSAALLLLDLPFWLIIGMAAGLLNLVPFVGPFVGGALAVVVALVEGEPSKALLAVVLFTAIQQVDNHIITPMVQRTRVLLSPLVIVLALIVGGSVAGLLGVLVAVPMVAVIRIVAGHLWRTRVLGETWEEAIDAAIEVTERPERLRSRSRRLQEERLFDTAELPPADLPAVEVEEPVTTER